MNCKDQAAALRAGRPEVRAWTSAPMECRQAGDSLTIQGYASVTGVFYDMGWYQERVARGAFAKTLAAGPDVQLLINHEGLPLARTGPSGTLQLREDGTGLHFMASLDAADPDAQRLVSKIKSGLMDQCSFAFRVVDQEWNDDYDQRTIAAVDLNRGDVSVCNYGASPTTSVSLRSLLSRRKRGMDLELAMARAWASKLRGKKK